MLIELHSRHKHHVQDVIITQELERDMMKSKTSHVALQADL